MDVLNNWHVDPMPEITQGMAVLSPQGHALNVYMEKSVADRAAQTLVPENKVTLYGYHAYNSKYGPGILVSDFEIQKTEVIKKFPFNLSKHGDE